MDSGLARQYKVPLVPKAQLRVLTLVNEKLTETGPVTYETTVLELHLKNHWETISFKITVLLQYPVILGIPWLRLHNPQLDWTANSLYLKSDYCKQHCKISSPVILSCIPDPKHRTDTSVSLISYSINTTLQSTSLITSTPQIPLKYQDFAEVFSQTKADIFPTERPFDCTIPLKDPFITPPFKPIYNLSQAELAIFKEYLTENF